MRKYLQIFKNWRIDVIAAVFTAGIALFVCDGEDIRTLMAAKAIGLLLIYTTACLVHHWKDSIRELDVFNIDGDEEREA